MHQKQQVAGGVMAQAPEIRHCLEPRVTRNTDPLQDRRQLLRGRTLLFVVRGLAAPPPTGSSNPTAKPPSLCRWRRCAPAAAPTRPRSVMMFFSVIVSYVWDRRTRRRLGNQNEWATKNEFESAGFSLYRAKCKTASGWDYQDTETSALRGNRASRSRTSRKTKPYLL